MPGRRGGPAHRQPREGPALDHEQLDAHEIHQGDHDQPDQEPEGQVGVREAARREQCRCKLLTTSTRPNSSSGDGPAVEIRVPVGAATSW